MIEYQCEIRKQFEGAELLVCVHMWHIVIFILLFTFSNECYNY